MKGLSVLGSYGIALSMLVACSGGPSNQAQTPANRTPDAAPLVPLYSGPARLAIIADPESAGILDVRTSKLLRLGIEGSEFESQFGPPEIKDGSPGVKGAIAFAYYKDGLDCLFGDEYKAISFSVTLSDASVSRGSRQFKGFDSAMVFNGKSYELNSRSGFSPREAAVIFGRAVDSMDSGESTYSTYKAGENYVAFYYKGSTLTGATIASKWGGAGPSSPPSK